MKQSNMKQSNMKQSNMKQSIKQINHFDKCLSLFISFIGIYTGVTRNYETQILICFIIYYLNDLTKNITTDFVIHHTLGLLVSFIGLYIKYNHLPAEQIRQMVLNMELTTPIFILSSYFDGLKPLFFISFFYCRIYMQYILLNDIKTYNEFMTMTITYPLYMVYYALFGLNMYWFMIMIKKLSKPFKDSKYIFCHKVIPFIRPIQFNLLNFYSTLSTYLYHEDVYTAIMNDIDMENYTSPQTMVHSIVNSIVSISSIEPCYSKYSIAVHACNMFNLYVTKDSNFDIIAIGVDTCFYFSSDALIIYYIFILVRIIKPFYNLNPMVLHILLLVLRSYKRV